jgi:hypothetical protein
MATKAPAIPHNPERAAWTVLLTSFTTFVALVFTLVFGGSWWLRNATANQTIAPVYSGAVQVTRPGRTAPEVNPPDIPVESTIVTESNVQSDLTFVSADGQHELAAVQVFGGSEVQIIQADSPRFSTGTASHHIVLRVEGGRVRAFVGVELDRPVVIEILSDPQAVTVLEVPGSNAEVEVDATESMVTVREGEATVRANNQAVVIAKDERTQVLPGAGPGTPVPAERNLVRNGDFGNELDGEWVLDIRAPADPAESAGAVTFPVIGGRRVVQFQRAGINFGQVGIVQNLERDVRGYTTLRLHMEVMLTNQDLKNCGQLGSECPLIAKINYVDIYGSEREWLQGYYYNYDPSLLGTFCATCSPQWPHEQWPKGKWQVYDSPNLLEVFSGVGTPAAYLRSITLYASGHTFSSFITDVQLLAE